MKKRYNYKNFGCELSSHFGLALGFSADYETKAFVDKVLNIYFVFLWYQLTLEWRFKKEKGTLIIINGKEEYIKGGYITYEQIAKLAFEDDYRPTISYDIMYRKGSHQNKKGLLWDGEQVAIIDKMEFACTCTYTGIESQQEY